MLEDTAAILAIVAFGSTLFTFDITLKALAP